MGVLVVEGSEYSGSAITAKLASEQNRGVFAVPGSIMSKMSWGPNLLIKQGAKLVQEWNDVVVELAPEVRRRLAEQCRIRLTAADTEESEALSRNPASLPRCAQSGSAVLMIDGVNGKVPQAVLSGLRPDVARNLDSLIESMEGVSPPEILTALFELEMAGLIRQLAGKNYVRVWND